MPKPEKKYSTKRENAIRLEKQLGVYELEEKNKIVYRYLNSNSENPRESMIKLTMKNSHAGQI